MCCVPILWFVVSAAMALPFSSFPNVNSAMVVDDFQRPFLTSKDFISTGLPLSVASIVMICTLGYWLITATAPASLHDSIHSYIVQ
jgi:di/tricarboxylate transporter